MNNYLAGVLTGIGIESIGSKTPIQILDEILKKWETLSDWTKSELACSLFDNKKNISA